MSIPAHSKPQSNQRAEAVTGVGAGAVTVTGTGAVTGTVTGAGAEAGVVQQWRSAMGHCCEGYIDPYAHHTKIALQEGPSLLICIESCLSRSSFHCIAQVAVVALLHPDLDPPCSFHLLRMRCTG